MARSFRTEPKWRIATRRIQRNSEGGALLPRIIERKPAPGDVVPMTKAQIAQALAQLPVELYYGIKAVEVRPRNGEEGRPYATYVSSEKSIRLYSLPLTIQMPWTTRFQNRLFRTVGASVRCAKDAVFITFPDQAALSFWFYHDVFAHELGHHHRAQYPSKSGRLGSTKSEEFLADQYTAWVPTGRFSPKKYETVKKQQAASPPRTRKPKSCLTC